MKKTKSLFATIASFFLLSFFTPAQAQPRDTDRERLIGEIAELNSRLRGTPAGRAAGLPLREAAEARRRAMVELMRTAPSEALSLALSAPERQALTAQDPSLDALLETQGRWSGDVETYIFDDFEGKTARTVNFLVSPSVRLEVHAAGRPLPGECGWTAEFEGIALDGVAAGFAVKLERAVGAGDCSNKGEQRTLAVAVSFPCYGLSMSLADVQRMVFAPEGPSLDHFVRVHTRGQAWVTGKAVPFRADREYGCREYDELVEAAIRALSETEDLTQYRRLLIFLPMLPGECYWGGLGTANCLRRDSLPTHWHSVSWMRVPMNMTQGAWDWVMRVVFHEVGHNFGFAHSNSRKFPAISLGAPGQKGESGEYGDPFTSMGGSGGPYTARQLLHAGWLAESEVITAEGEGTYTIEAVAAQNTGPKVLRIRRLPGVDEWLWVEYHKPEGPYYAWWPSVAPQGALVYVLDNHNQDWSEMYGGPPNLLDMTPGSRAEDFRDAVLAVGREWQDSYSGLRIRVVRAAERLEVEVFRDRPCVKVEPESKSHGPGEEDGAFSVSGSPNCQWEAMQSEPWIEFTGAKTGAGGGTVTYRVSANEGLKARVGHIAIGRTPLRIEQLPVNRAPVVVSLSPSEGSGPGVELLLRATDPNGVEEITTIGLRVAQKEGGDAACWLEYDVAESRIRLATDTGSNWLTAATGHGLNLENSRCVVRSAIFRITPEGEAHLRVNLRFSVGFAGGKTVFVALRDRWGAWNGWEEAGQWRVVDEPLGGFASATPSSGPGARLSFVWYLLPGGSPIQRAWINIGEREDWENSCSLSYEANPDRLSVYLGEGKWTPPAAFFTNTVLQGRHCKVLKSWVWRTGSGDVFWFTVDIAFPESFAGPRKIWMYAVNTLGGRFPWTESGRLTVTGPNRTPRIASVVHQPISGNEGVLEVTVHEADGGGDIETLEVVINDRNERDDACVVELRPQDRALALRADFSRWEAGSFNLSSPRLLENSQCRLDGARSSMTMGPDGIQLRLALTLKPVMAGEQRIFVRATDLSGAQSQWFEAGPWVVASAPGNRTPDVSLEGPAFSRGHFLSAPLRLTDPDGPRDVAAVELLIGASTDDPAPCWLRFTRKLGRIELRSEENQRWISANARDTLLAHSRCSVPAHALLRVEGNSALITMGAAFRQPFNGNKFFWARAIDSAGLASGWRRLGDLLVSVPASNRPPTAAAAQVGPMSGPAGILQLTATDPDGNFDVRQIAVRFRKETADQDVCLLLYDALSRVQLAADGKNGGWVLLRPSGPAVAGACSLLGARSDIWGNSPLQWLPSVLWNDSVHGPLLADIQALDMSGTISAWVRAFSWDVKHPNQFPSAVQISPSSGQGSEAILEISAQDPDGPHDIASMLVTISSGPGRQSSCSFYIDEAFRRVGLFLDDGGWSNVNTMGSDTVLENGQCQLRLNTVTTRIENGWRIVRVPIRFLAGLAGQRTIRASATDVLGARLEASQTATWTVPQPAPNQPPAAESLVRLDSGGQLSLTATFSDADGYGHLSFLDIRVGETGPVCAIRYDRISQTFSLSEDGLAWLRPVAINSSAPLASSVCSIVPSQVQIRGTGRTLTLNLAVALRSPLSLSDPIWLRATDLAGDSTGWVRR
jgi:hypothetical protein